MEGRFARALFLARLFLLLCHIGVLRAGYIGCKFSEIVCLEDEVCIDDQLFGNCQKWEGPKDYYQFDLDDRSLKILEGELLQLIENGYTWDNPYTQCILGGLLGGFREGMSFDRRYCGDDFPKDTEGDLLTPEVLETLYRYLGKGDLSPAPSVDDSPDTEEAFADISSQPSVDKKDEIVKVHKYFVNKDDKRGFGEGAIEGFGDEYSDLPTDGADSQLNEVLNDLSPQDLAALEDYLSFPQKPQEPVYSERAPDDLDLESYAPQENPQFQDEPVLDPDDDPIWGDVDDDESPASPPDTEAEEPPSSLADPELPGVEADEMLQALSPDDAKLLSDLISGKIDVDGLSSEQVDRLNQYVNLLLGFLEPPEDQEQEVDGSASIGKLKEAEGKVKKIPPVVKKEQADYASVSSPQGQSRVSVHFKDKKTSLQEAGAAVAQAKRKVAPALQDKYAYIDANFVDIEVVPSFSGDTDGRNFLRVLAQLANIPDDRFSNVELSPDKAKVNFKVYSDGKVNASRVATIAEEKSERLKNKTGHSVVKASLGRGDTIGVQEHSLNTPKYYVLTLVLCGVIASAVIAGILIYVLRRHSNALNKLSQLSQNGDTAEASQDYQDLCRQRMQSKASEKPEPIHPASRVSSVSTQEAAVRSPSSRSSTSSWSEEPASSSMDITTGHIVLSYMEDHLKNKDRLDQEWEALCAYEAEPNSTVVACDASNMRRNRYSDILPYDHSRVVLSKGCNVSASDYINGSSITDHDPRNPAYIATQGPLPHTVADFWQMVWEQGGVVIVNLTKLTENGVAMCHRYWPEEGSDLYHIYEVHLVSEHIWCEDYLVRSFYLKNLQTNETRTVTQFHFLTWTDLGVPSSVKALLDFRRKVNKSYRGRSCPIVVQCSDGAGRTGTYCLIDMVLNRMGKGAKEIDIAATLEHIRDQRMGMVKTKEQFEFALAAVAEEVHAILKALPQ